MENIHLINNMKQQFKALALAQGEAKNRSTYTQALTSTVMQIALHGDETEKNSMEVFFSKEGDGHKARSVLSKANTIIRSLKQGPITLEDGAEVTLEAVQNVALGDVMPFTLSTVYAVAKKVSDEKAKLATEARSLEAEALALYCAERGLDPQVFQKENTLAEVARVIAATMPQAIEANEKAKVEAQANDVKAKAQYLVTEILALPQEVIDAIIVPGLATLFPAPAKKAKAA